MPMNIHFFSNTQTGRINYQELLDFFQEQPGFEIFYDNEQVDIICSDDEFGFQYQYKITKVSQVVGIYKLNAAYLNINFMLCLPILIPAYAVKEILGSAQKLVKQFDLAVYVDTYDDVKPFNVHDLFSEFVATQKKYLEENKPEGKHFVDGDKLTAICKYERTIDNLKECFHGEIEVNHCKALYNKENDEFGICTYWYLGKPTAFVPYFNYVSINDEDGEFKVRRNDFFKFMERYIQKIDSYLPDLYILKKKPEKASHSVIGKLKKLAITDATFEEVKIADLIDKN